MKTVYVTDKPVLTQAQLDQIRALDGVVPDTTDIPEAPESSWANARRLKPGKEAISIRLDADLLVWLRGRSEHYQPEINRILRERMNAELLRS